MSYNQNGIKRVDMKLNIPPQMSGNHRFWINKLKENVKKEKFKYLLLSENVNITYQNFWDTVREVFREN